MDNVTTMSIASNLSELEKVKDQFIKNEATFEVETTGNNSKPVEPNSVKVLRDKIGCFVNHDFVSNFIMFLIIMNSIMLGLATFPFVYDNPSIQHVFDLTDKIFQIIFTVELIMQLIYHDITLFKDGWLVFYFFVVLLS